MALTKPLMLVLAAALVAAAPAHAQRQSLADRVSALEIQANNTQGNMELLNRVTQQENELRQLREQIELLQNELEQMKQRNRDQYLDLDGRLNRLEGGAPGAVPPVAVPSASTAPGPAIGPSEAATAEAAPRVHGDVGAMAQAGDERTSYNVAFDRLKAGDYVDSAQLFTSFLELYPNGVYAPNALYWLGESYYVTQNYQMAAQQFRALMERYPTHDKAAGSLLKLGLSEYGMGQVQQAESTLALVVSQYPGSDVARTADDRLRAIQLGRIR
jgi:tol-pal system protein YbgF